ncbi:MAG TPA: carbohydrate kinase family protein [Pseudonocardiaceae bacterium]
MRIAVTGSIATDHLMFFPGRFTEQFVSDRLDRVSLSFLVDDLMIRRGGVAANIAFGLGVLGLRPVLVGAVGSDFDDYRTWLERHGVDTGSVHVSRTRHTARFLCTTDQDQNQIASFYAGAMVEARDIALRPVAERVGGLDLVVVAPNDPEAMLRHTAECRAQGYRFAADPSQQLARMSGTEITELVDGAHLLFTNEYESALLLEKTGWSHADVLARVGSWVTTLGDKGVRIESAHAPAVEVPAAPEQRRVDPTGVGDAFRAGFLAALAWGLGTERAAQVGCQLAVLVLETAGTQEYVLHRADFLDRLRRAYGAEVAEEVAEHLVPARSGP